LPGNVVIIKVERGQLVQRPQRFRREHADLVVGQGEGLQLFCNRRTCFNCSAIEEQHVSVVLQQKNNLFQLFCNRRTGWSCFATLE
jgi:hypothetical protein